MKNDENFGRGKFICDFLNSYFFPRDRRFEMFFKCFLMKCSTIERGVLVEWRTNYAGVEISPPEIEFSLSENQKPIKFPLILLPPSMYVGVFSFSRMPRYELIWCARKICFFHLDAVNILTKWNFGFSFNTNKRANQRTNEPANVGMKKKKKMKIKTKRKKNEIQ